MEKAFFIRVREFLMDLVELKDNTMGSSLIRVMLVGFLMDLVELKALITSSVTSLVCRF